MMISPDGFINEHKEKTYEQLLSVRDELIREIRRFEKGKIPEEEKYMHPSPDVRYQCNLSYLSKICNLIADKYNEQLWED